MYRLTNFHSLDAFSGVRREIFISGTNYFKTLFLTCKIKEESITNVFLAELEVKSKLFDLEFLLIFLYPELGKTYNSVILYIEASQMIPLLGNAKGSVQHLLYCR